MYSFTQILNHEQDATQDQVVYNWFEFRIFHLIDGLLYQD